LYLKLPGGPPIAKVSDPQVAIGRQGTDLQGTDCNAVLETAVKNLHAAIHESGAQVTHDLLPTVIADGSQLLQVFQNLIGNALKFRGSDPPAIHVSASKKRSEWIFSVALQMDRPIPLPEYSARVCRRQSRD